MTSAKSPASRLIFSGTNGPDPAGSPTFCEPMLNAKLILGDTQQPRWRLPGWPEPDQHPRRPGGGHRDRPGDEARQSGQEATAAPDALAEAGAGDNRHGKGQRVGGHRPLQTCAMDVQAALDRRQTDRDEGWHREHQWMNLFTATCGPPQYPQLYVLPGRASGSMTRVNGFVRGSVRLAGSAGLAG